MNFEKHILVLLLSILFFDVSVLAQQNQSNNSKAEDSLISLDNPKKVTSMINIDSTGLLLFGEDLSENLNKTKNLKVFKLSHYLSGQSDSTEILEGFTILDTKDIKVEKQKQIAKLLTSTTPYILDKNIKNLCLFMPDMGMELSFDDQKINALVSLECKMVRFYFQDEKSGNRFIELNSKQSFNGFDLVFDDIFNSTPTIESLDTDNTKSINLASSNNNANVLLYQVKPGQGLSHVAKYASIKFDRKISINEICSLNKFDKKVILKKGQKVIVGYIE